MADDPFLASIIRAVTDDLYRLAAQTDDLDNKEVLLDAADALSDVLDVL